jgi:hypothetical protein
MFGKWLLPFSSCLTVFSLTNLIIKIYKTIILPVVLYGSETWYLSLREDQWLRVFENRVLWWIFGPEGEEMAAGMKGLHNEKLRLATRWMIGVLGFDSRRGLGIFLFTVSRLALGSIHPPIHWVPGALSVGVKRPERETDHLPPSSAEVKNAWSCTSILPIHLQFMVLN